MAASSWSVRSGSSDTIRGCQGPAGRTQSGPDPYCWASEAAAVQNVSIGGPAAALVVVALHHEVVEPPQPVQAAGDEQRDDASDVAVPLLRGAGGGQAGGHAEGPVDGRQLLLRSLLGGLVADEVHVEEDVADDLADPTRHQGDERPDHGVAELASQPAQLLDVAPCRLEARCQLLAPTRGNRPLPCQGERRVEDVDAALVVLDGSPEQAVEDVEAVDPARQDRPAERRPEVEQVVRVRPASDPPLEALQCALLGHGGQRIGHPAMLGRPSPAPPGNRRVWP